MGIIIYDNGETYEVDPKDIYDPFPEKKEDEQESSREENKGYNEKETKNEHKIKFVGPISER